MVVDRLCITDSVVAHVLATTILTNLNVGVAVQLSDVGGRNPTLSMEPIDVLANNELEMIFLG